MMGQSVMTASPKQLARIPLSLRRSTPTIRPDTDRPIREGTQITLPHHLTSYLLLLPGFFDIRPFHSKPFEVCRLLPPLFVLPVATYSERFVRSKCRVHSTALSGSTWSNTMPTMPDFISEAEYPVPYNVYSHSTIRYHFIPASQASRIHTQGSRGACTFWEETGPCMSLPIVFTASG